MKKFLVLLVGMLLYLNWPVIKAEDDLYHVANSTSSGYTEVASFSTLEEALVSYNANVAKYDNLVLYRDDTVYLMEYGVVEFVVDDTCSLELSYTDESGTSKSINGCYGVDALYLSSSSDLTTVNFAISGDVGTIDFENVILHPYETLSVSISNYYVLDDELYHDIKSQLAEDYVYSSIVLGPAPTYLSSDVTYYSYDGQYFYESFYTMSDDYRSGSRAGAINSEDVYYNYYMYLPHRSTTNYTYQELESYFSDTLVFDKTLDTYRDFNYDNANDDVNRSQYVGNIDAFFENEAIYGANAMMMLALSIHESSYGKSLSAYTENNLFGHVAFDTAKEISSGRYSSVAKSVYAHARYYISSRYSNPTSASYTGSFFGNKASGMNTTYSSNPYWGEILAANYYAIDKALGLKDYGSNAIAIIEDVSSITLYSDSDLSEELVTISDISPYALIVLEEGEDYYKVQYDGASDVDGYTYAYATDVAYISKNVVDFILFEEAIHEDTYYEITFVISEEETLTISVKEGQIPTIDEPELDEAVFVGYDRELEAAYEDTTYTATYHNVVSIVLDSYVGEVALNGVLSLEGMQLQVTYSYYDESQKEVRYTELVDVTSDMVSNYDLSKEGSQTVIVSYCGLVTSYPLEVRSDLYEYEVYLDETLPDVIERLMAGEEVSIDEVLYIKQLVFLTDYVLDNDEIVLLDQILLSEYREYVNFCIDSPYELAISGIALAIDIDESYRNGFKLYADTYYLSSGISSIQAASRLEKISAAYGFETVMSFSLSFRKNSQTLSSEGPFIVQISLEGLDTHKIYTVYSIDENGDVVKCRTSQSTNAIQFTTTNDGDFMILALDSSNDYTIDDPMIFNITTANADIDLNAYLFVYIGLGALVIIDGIAYVLEKILRRRLEVLWSDYRRSWRQPV